MLGFRLWSVKQKCFVISPYSVMNQAGELDTRDGSHIPPYIPMRSTGLKDCNGIEIFEGDVLIDGHSYFHVSSIVDFLLAMGQDEEAFLDCKSNRILMFPIIGNRFENPELLEKCNAGIRYGT